MRLIDADALLESIAKIVADDSMTPTEKIGRIIIAVTEAPTADAVPVVHGRWEPHPNANGFERCSVCHDCIIYDDWATEQKWYYCPNCGARMDGDSRA